MSPFASPQEARDVGVPLLRLFRAALGRDPESPDGLAALVAAWRDGKRMTALAAGLLQTEEGRARHGGAPPDAPDGRTLAESTLAERTLAESTLAERTLAETLAAAAFAAPPGEPAPLPALFLGSPPDDPVAYAFWREEVEAGLPAPPSSPLSVTVAMLVGDSGAEGALRSLDSLRAQTHPAWTLAVVPRARSAWGRDALRGMAEHGSVRLLDAGADLAGAMTEADEGAVCLLDPGDVLAPHALACVAAAFSADPAAMMVYTDEDRIDGTGARSRPRFKSGFGMDAMLAGCMTGQLAAFRTGLMRRLGGPRPSAAPFEAYDLALRGAAEAGAGAVRHVARILCHRAEPPTDWPAAAGAPPREAPDLALEPASATADAPWPRLRARLTETPSVSVLMPTRNRAGLLRTAAAGVLSGTDYPALELLVVDHASTEPDAVALLAELARDPRVRVLRQDGAFNFAAINNHAARQARGEVLLLLNNDVEIVEPGWLREMAGHAMRPDVGAVGARLLHRDGTLQHGGIALGPEGRAVHILSGAAPGDPGYLGQLACVRDVAAVTAACLAIRRDVWARVGGMDEGFPVTWNDVDLCQRVRAAGLRVIWTPFASLTHLEGSTRGRDGDDPARQAALKTAQARHRAIWGRAADEDPFLNPNLSATGHGLCLGPSRAT